MSLITYCKTPKKWENSSFEQVLANCRNINNEDQYGWSALMLVVNNSATNPIQAKHILTTLYDLGADINLQNMDGSSVLIVSIENLSRNNPEMRFTLLHYGVDTNVKNKKGDTALWLSITKCQWPFTKLLIVYGVNINFPSGRGTTPIVQASRWSRQRHKTMSGILSIGACLDIQNTRGETAVSVVCDNLDKPSRTQSTSTPIGLVKLIEMGAKIIDKYIDFESFPDNLQIYMIKNGYFFGSRFATNIMKWSQQQIDCIKEEYTKVQYQIHPGTEFWDLLRQDYPNISPFDLLKNVQKLDG